MTKVTIPPEQQFKLEQTKIEGGLLGKFFGTGDQFNKTSLFFIILILAVIGIIYIFQNLQSSLGYWKDIFLPLFTLVAGYFFGKNSDEK